MDWDDVDGDTTRVWPRLSEVVEYRRAVRTAIDSLITSSTLALPISSDSPFYVLLMCAEN